MSVYRLEPIKGTETSHHWEASTLAPITVWIQANDEKRARELLTTATIIATRARPGRDLPIAPWKDFGLCVACLTRAAAFKRVRS